MTMTIKPIGWLILGLWSLELHPQVSAEQVLTPIDWTQWHAQWSAYWSPDNAHITYTDWTTTKVKGLEREWNWDIYIMDSTGAGVTNISNHPATDIDSNWAPDGQQVCFSSDRDGDFDIYIMNRDGSDLKNITKNDRNEFYPKWSPDGSMIAYQVSHHQSSDIYILNLITGDLANLTKHPANDTDPSWAFDSQSLVFTSNRDGNQEIYRIGVDGSGLQRLTYTPAQESTPSLSHDGRLIAFGSTRDGLGPRKAFQSFSQNYIMNADGSNIRRISYTPTGGNSQIDWSMDDRRLLFNSWKQSNRGIYLADIDGKNEKRISPNAESDFVKMARKKGVKTAIAALDEAKVRSPHQHFYTSSEVDQLAFELLYAGELREVHVLLQKMIHLEPENELYQDILLIVMKMEGEDAPPYPDEIATELRKNFVNGISMLKGLIKKYPDWYLLDLNSILQLNGELELANCPSRQLVLLNLALEKYPKNSQLLEAQEMARKNLGLSIIN